MDRGKEIARIVPLPIGAKELRPDLNWKKYQSEGRKFASCFMNKEIMESTDLQLSWYEVLTSFRNPLTDAATAIEPMSVSCCDLAFLSFSKALFLAA